MANHVAKLLACCTDPSVGATLVDLLGEDLGKHELSELGFEVSPGWARTIRRGRGRYLTVAAAASPSSPEALDDLAYDSRLSVRRAVANNSNASPETLERLFRWGVRRDEVTARNVFWNSSLPAATALALYVECVEDEAVTCPVDEARMANKAAEDADVFRAAFDFLTGSGLRSPLSMATALSFTADELATDVSPRPVVFADLFCGGALEGLVDDEVITEALEKSFAEYGTIGAALVEKLVESDRMPEIGPGSKLYKSLSRRACIEVFDRGGPYRTWALRSAECPPELAWDAISVRRPEARDVASVFSRFAALSRPTELVTLLAAARRASVGLDRRGDLLPVVHSIQRMASSIAKRERSAPRPKTVLDMCRLSNADVTQLLLPYLSERHAAQLWENPMWAFASSGSAKRTDPAPSVVYRTLGTRSPAAEHLLVNVPGMPEQWTRSPSGWRSEFVFGYLHSRLGDDAEAWRFAVSLVSSWEGSFAELVVVAAAGAGLELDGADDEAARPELLSECTPGVLPLVFAD